MTIKISVVGTKGGIGKTSLAVNLGAYLADCGLLVLLIDADPQPTSSGYYPLEFRAPGGLTTLLVESTRTGVVGPQVVAQSISHTAIERLHIVLSDDPEARLHDWIRDTPDGRLRLRYILDKALDQKYDVILIDTQGAVGGLQGMDRSRDANLIAQELRRESFGRRPRR
ncbi:MAG: ParA family protein [Pseudomonadota bacterium]|nr:ParA family protein [Pseudomonadota bacterium]